MEPSVRPGSTSPAAIEFVPADAAGARTGRRDGAVDRDPAVARRRRLIATRRLTNRQTSGPRTTCRTPFPGVLARARAMGSGSEAACGRAPLYRALPPARRPALSVP